MHIVFHGLNAQSFRPDFERLVGQEMRISVLPDVLSADTDRSTFASADVVVGNVFNAQSPVPQKLRLFHLPAAGYDAVDMTLVPAGAVVCNCFGHEQAIAEYVFGALLTRAIPIAESDAQLRKGDWTHRAGTAASVHGELAGKTIGILGFGHIGKAIAARAKAFEMVVHAANRSAIMPSPLVDRAFGMDRLSEFIASADVIVVGLPLSPETTGLVNAQVLQAMRSDAVIINVGRGATIDEAALYAALEERRIGGAIIDTWYVYPSPGNPHPHPASLPFHMLDNVVMTPHMSGWTLGTIRRRQKTIADNILNIATNQACINVVRPAQSRL